MSDSAVRNSSPLNLLAGGGEMGRRIREFDWASTSVGPIDTWSPALRTMVPLLLANRFPQLLWWGKEYVQFYNDAYRPIPGTKHPDRALGVTVRECWSEIWHVLQPLIDGPFHGGPATWNDDILLEINRHGFVEESHFTIAYSPVPDETVPGGIGGVLATVHEITGKIVGERRIVVLRDLARASEARCEEEACSIVAETLSRHDKDVPFAILYLVDPATKQARLTGTSGVAPGLPISPRVVDLKHASSEGWPLFEASQSMDIRLVERIGGRFADVPPGPWSDVPHTAAIVPLPTNKAQELAGFMIVGISARLQFDEAYHAFLELVRTQVAAAVANARAYEEERQRAEALAALDRAKTQFFSNVSHEFRTPLTLMLGPVEDLLHSQLPPEATEQLDVVHRNSLRLLRLVNTMLEFTRIEAGRMSAAYEPVDLPAFTADLASSFRSTCERAGLRLIVNCPPLNTREPAYVDRDMWEKIVLNLVSNAFKFTLEGEIEVRVDATSDDTARLVVRDTGVGVPADELPRMFDRFHRIANSAARTHEGTGIGLALVQELVKLHGGTITVESVVGEGTRFTVTIPLGSAHLEGRTVQSAGRKVDRATTDAFVEEAMRWIPGTDTMQRVAPSQAENGVEPDAEVEAGPRPRILWADDNADMREYVARLLRDRYEVESVANGREALEAAHREPPDLLLTDVMMPQMDGFELLRELRASERLRNVPVIMVSARAGEGSRIGGMEAGADDYLVKPFSARELVARVDAHLRMALIRSETERAQMESAERVVAANEELSRRVMELEKANAEIIESRQTAQSLMIDALLAKEQLREADRRKDEFLATLAHELRNPLAPIRNAVAILDLKSSGEPELKWSRQVINRQMQQMTRLVDDLLDMSRISRGKIELKRERLELAKVIHGAVEASRPLMEQCAHELNVTFPTESIYLDADETRLIQVFCNLLNNAAKYSENQGRIALTATRFGGEVVVTVRDSGFGIPERVLPHIFDMFTQADPSDERSKGGLGVGLTLVKRLVELHGGTVEARSEGPGKGSEFTVRLPIMPDASLAKSSNADGTELGLSASSRRILVVDDNHDAADTMSMMLRLRGHDVKTSYDGVEALQAAGEFRPDVVLLDIGLPGLSGYETARCIRREPWGRRMALVAVTGWGQREDRRRSSEAGFDFHIVKPVDPASLMSLLSSLKPADAADQDGDRGTRRDHVVSVDAPSAGVR
jgi:signal transduction histidine kinase